MATMASTDIQIVNISNLEKIETFLNDSAYRELIENSENYNTRLCIERRLRMPFLDPQTGVAQNHCALFMKRRQRMPGLREGQIYSYPSGRWRKSRRQYLIHQHRPFRVIREPDPDSLQGLSTLSSSGGGGVGSGPGGAQDTDSRDSHGGHGNETPKEWFYDEVNMHEIDPFEDRDPDSDFDYDDNNYKKKRRGRKPNPDGVSTRGRGRGRGRGRRKMLDADGTPIRTPSKRGRPTSVVPVPQSPSLHQPLPAASSSTAAAALLMTPAIQNPQVPVLLSNSTISPGNGAGQPAPPAPGVSTATATTTPNDTDPPMPVLTPEQPIEDEERVQMLKPTERGKATPSPYCDFCLGDSRENRKTNIPEDLVSCSDCGRSGHPTCLQFTPNMIVSVRRYRWQCIECKYCSICGTSDNDDQLLFCDDCDRGYHMYCLTPPLIVPPEGSWSCNICHEEFHSNT